MEEIDIHTREELYRWYEENHDKVSDFWLRVNRTDAQAWAFYLSSPENYRRIKVDRIQHYHRTGRDDYAQRLLAKFIADCHAGKLQGGWNDFGRL